MRSEVELAQRSDLVVSSGGLPRQERSRSKIRLMRSTASRATGSLLVIATSQASFHTRVLCTSEVLEIQGLQRQGHLPLTLPNALPPGYGRRARGAIEDASAG